MLRGPSEGGASLLRLRPARGRPGETRTERAAALLDLLADRRLHEALHLHGEPAGQPGGEVVA